MVPAGDGRELEVLRAGPERGLPFVFHGGTPTAASEFPHIAQAALERGWQFVMYSRPGYARSTAQPGRSVADASGDTAEILDLLNHDRFVTLGWSGGGPHALACAALLPDRCAAAATLAGAAPYPAEGIDWLRGMGPENVEEFGAAIESPGKLTAYLQRQAPSHAAVTGEEIAAVLGGLVSDVDRLALTGELADTIAASLRRALSAGIAGWLDDDLAFTRPWGFELSEISVPVSVWQGARDMMVPFAHGQWLAANTPGARAHLYDHEGHISLLQQMPRILDDLEDQAWR
jgi:pimeloyl-ACP methyl ester carboxylesterase